jgi:hypothetical protein
MDTTGIITKRLIYCLTRHTKKYYKVIPCYYMATEEQLKLLKNQGITHEKYLSKIEARRLISKISKQ